MINAETENTDHSFLSPFLKGGMAFFEMVEKGRENSIPIFRGKIAKGGGADF